MSQTELLKPNNDVKAVCDTELDSFHFKIESAEKHLSVGTRYSILD